MFCQNCGTKLNEDGICPNCGTVPHVEAERVSEKKSKERKMPTKGSKSYAALMSALLVFPATVSVALDLSFTRYDYWCGFVVGAILVFWVCAVFPSMRLTPAPVTAIISFSSIVCYILYICHKTGHMEILFNKALPLFLLFCLFVAIDSALFSSGKIKGLTGAAILSGEVAIYLLAIEMVCRDRPINFHLLPIFACGFISVAAVLIAFQYIGNINKK